MSCVRCGRPACPDCLRSAAVGQQCVECVREGNRGTRRAARRVRRPGCRGRGGHLDSGRHQHRCSTSWSWLARASRTTGRCSARPGSRRAARSSRGRRRPVVPADHLRVPAAAGAERPRAAGHRVQHVGADPRRPGAGAAAGPAAVPRRVPGERARRLGDVLLRRPAERRGAGRLRRDLRPVRRLVRGGQAAAAGQPVDRGGLWC